MDNMPPEVMNAMNAVHEAGKALMTSLLDLGEDADTASIGILKDIAQAAATQLTIAAQALEGAIDRSYDPTEAS